MNARPHPTGLSRTASVAAAVVSALMMLMISGGAKSSLAIVLPPIIVSGCVAATVWAVRRSRADRAAYESQLTAWAATEAVLAERLRIAHDLHDIVSHGLGLITVRAAATRHLSKSAQVASALTDIEEASRRATAELRRMLAVLREPSDSGLRAPMDSLENLPDIVHEAALAGLRTRLTVEPLGSVSQGVQVAVCKIIREALGNTARHAGPTDARIHVGRDGPFVIVTVADAGPSDDGWQPSPGAGHGLVGLLERVGSLGGTLSARPAAAGFLVTARIPDEVR